MILYPSEFKTGKIFIKMPITKKRAMTFRVLNPKTELIINKNPFEIQLKKVPPNEYTFFHNQKAYTFDSFVHRKKEIYN
ncbi:hypothetical protein [Butyrivibrio sp. NC3005]|uniref:hypothetical protein n=1 Tax=Butyrivibrio sp. NC3005 TaxID=1280685 RepID=UPI0004798852|nr:hypothetical protein [Butyrivibrio sp. NC3005]